MQRPGKRRCRVSGAAGVRVLIDGFWRRLSGAVPRRFVYWCIVRAINNATSGRWSKEMSPNLGALDCLDRWAEWGLGDPSPEGALPAGYRKAYVALLLYLPSSVWPMLLALDDSTHDSAALKRYVEEFAARSMPHQRDVLRWTDHPHGLSVYCTPRAADPMWAILPVPVPPMSLPVPLPPQAPEADRE